MATESKASEMPAAASAKSTESGRGAEPVTASAPEPTPSMAPNSAPDEPRAAERGEETLEAMEARMAREQRLLTQRQAKASVVDEIETDSLVREGRLDTTIPGGYYLQGGRMVGGKLVGAQAVDAEGRPIRARR